MGVSERSHFDRAAHRVHHAAELHNSSIAGALDDATTVHGDYWINQIAADRPEPSQRTLFVSTGEPAITDHIRDEDCRNFPGLAHRPPSDVGTLAQKGGQVLPKEPLGTTAQASISSALRPDPPWD
jgi:hypothetical protein